MIVRSGVATLRAKPEKTGRFLARLIKRTPVEAIRREGDWVLVKVPGRNGQEGWIHWSLLTTAAAQ